MGNVIDMKKNHKRYIKKTVNQFLNLNELQQMHDMNKVILNGIDNTINEMNRIVAFDDDTSDEYCDMYCHILRIFFNMKRTITEFDEKNNKILNQLGEH
jgi:hypothetical protein